MEDVAALRRPGVWLWAGAALYACLILAISSVPARNMPDIDLIWSNDKLVHALEYALLGWLVVGALRARGEGRRAFAIAAVVCVAFGAVDELLQGTVPGRSSSVYDFMADGIGSVLGAGVGAIWWDSTT